MCLKEVTESYQGRGIGPIIAFKKFKLVDGEIRNMFQKHDTPWKIGKERSAGPKTVKIGNARGTVEYPSGFHAYATKSFSSWLGPNGVWAKVRLRGVQTKGKQGFNRTVYVARYCKILEIL